MTVLLVLNRTPLFLEFSSYCVVFLGNNIWSTLCGMWLPLLSVSLLCIFVLLWLLLLFNFMTITDPMLLKLKDAMYTIHLGLLCESLLLLLWVTVVWFSLWCCCFPLGRLVLCNYCMCWLHWILYCLLNFLAWLSGIFILWFLWPMLIPVFLSLSLCHVMPLIF